MTTLWPIDWNKATFSGSLADILGQVPTRARLYIKPNVTGVLTSLGSKTTVLSIEREIPTDAITGGFSVSIPATNDPKVNPTGFTYRVRITMGTASASDIMFDMSAPMGQNVTLIDSLNGSVIPGTGRVRVTAYEYAVAAGFVGTEAEYAASITPAALKGVQGVQGIQGVPGPVNSLAIGTVETGSTAASITGSAPSQTLNLTLQQGIQGIQGVQGIKGDKGDQGIQGVKGDTGSAASIGDVAGLSTALAAKASVSGTVFTGPVSIPSATLSAHAANLGDLTANTIATRERVTLSSKHGVVADGVTDDSAALLAAVAEAKAGRASTTNRGLSLPAELGIVYLNTVVDLRYLTDLDIACKVRIGASGKLVVGHTSAQRPGQRISIREVVWLGTQTNCCIEMRGLKQADVWIGACSRLDLIADDTVNPVTDGSFAYNTFRLGYIKNLNLTGIGNGWITQNAFFGGDVVNLVMSGAYGHNQNGFYGVCFEGGSITLETGTRNVFRDIRGEGGTVVTFGPPTGFNLVVDNYVSNPRIRQPGVVVVDNSTSRTNWVYSLADEQMASFELVSIDNQSQLYDSARDSPGDAALVPGIDRIGYAPWSNILDTGIIPIREDQALAPYEGSWRMGRFELASDVTAWRFEAQLYDASGAVITDPSAMVTLASWDAGRSSWRYATDAAVNTFQVMSGQAKFIRIKVGSSGTVQPFRYLRLTGFLAKPSKGVGPSVAIRKLRLSPYQVSAPTKGVARVGDVVAGPASSWVCSTRADTTLVTGNGAALTVASGLGISVGDVIGVLLDTGSTHWTKVSAVSGADITLAAALPSLASAGAAIVANGWKTTGAAGPANTLTAGTVTTGSPGTSAIATVTGTAPSQTLNLTIPRGDAGATGATGAAGIVTVNHGSTAGTARPAGAPVVYWVGTVKPTNATAYDWWLTQ